MALSLTLTHEKILSNWIKEAFTVFGASVLIALFAPLSVKLPFSPVPIALQLHLILFLAVTLGSKRAAGAVLTYLAYGAMGMPVFAGGGTGIATLVGPTGGYLLGYLLAAYLTGSIVERAKERILFAVVMGNLVVLATGALYLSLFVGSFSTAILVGVLPFVAGDALKTVLVVRALKRN